jgi:hypothetical protein
LPGSLPEGIVVTFTGNGCTVSGPAELSAGDVTFVLRVLSSRKENAGIYLTYIRDGKTFEDVLATQAVPGRWWPKPDWLVYARIINAWRNESRNEIYETYSLEEGDLVVFIGATIPGVELWTCAPVKVVDAPSG